MLGGMITIGDAKHLQDLANNWALARRAVLRARLEDMPKLIVELTTAENALYEFVLELGR